jgi:hypothetical protein
MSKEASKEPQGAYSARCSGDSHQEGLLRQMGPRSTRWGTGIWFLLCTVLAGGVALELVLPIAPQVTAARLAAPLPEFAPEPGAFEPPPRHVFAEIVARPLFSASRRPFVGESGGEAVPGEGLAIELVGTLLTKQGAAALLQPSGQDARWLHAGDTIAGWQVEAIQRDKVSLQLDDEAKTLELRADLNQPAQTPRKAERRRDEGNAQPGDQAQAQDNNQQPDNQNRAQDQEGEPDPAQGGEIEEAEPRTE